MAENSSKRAQKEGFLKNKKISIIMNILKTLAGQSLIKQGLRTEEIGPPFSEERQVQKWPRMTVE